MKQFKKFTLKKFISRGYELTPIEFKDDVPFEVKRCYYLSNFKDQANTGEHCHKIEEEVFFVMQGDATAVIDSGSGRIDVVLLSGEAVYIPSYVWHGFKNLSRDAIIFALSSTNYSPDRSDYIENYEEFLRVRPEVK